MARYRVIDKATAVRRRAILNHQEAVAAQADGRPYAALELMQKAHKRLPSLAPIAVHAAELAGKLDKPRLARKILETSWRGEPHPELIRAFAGLEGQSSPAERLKQAERLRQLHPEHVASDLSLAEEAIVAKDWATARSALDRALKKDPTARAYRMLAEVEQAEGEGEKTRMYLAKAVDAPPDPAWLCQGTGEVRAVWSAFGPDGRFDSLRWGKPSKIVPMLGEERALLIPPSAPTRSEAKPATTTAAPAGAARTAAVVRVEPAAKPAPDAKRNKGAGKVDAA
jgi:HemY protein